MLGETGLAGPDYGVCLLGRRDWAGPHSIGLPKVASAESVPTGGHDDRFIAGRRSRLHLGSWKLLVAVRRPRRQMMKTTAQAERLQSPSVGST